MKRVKLSTGSTIPQLGLGTFKIRGQEIVHGVLDSALAAGYRLFDTASVYRNEEDIGKSLQMLLPQYGLTRQDIFITSKLGPRDQGGGKCRAACLQSLDRLQCSYLDLFLIHWPGSQKLRPEDPQHQRNRLGSWTDMEQLLSEGKVRAIGVSNYMQRHLVEFEAAGMTVPAVLQSEFHPHLIQSDELAWCRKHGVHFQAYSSLGTSIENNKLLCDPVVKEIAESMQRTTAQVLLRWAIQQGIGVIPKSTNPQHIKENMDIFDFSLTEEDMKRLCKLDTGTHYCWDPMAVM